MIILSDANNNVVGSFIDGTKVTTIPDQTIPNPTAQVGRNPVLVIEPSTNTLSYNYVSRPLTTQEMLTQDQEQQAAMMLALVTGGLM